MNKMIIFEPALCCETGLCGVGIDPELLRISTTVNALKNNNVDIHRYNLNIAPMEFVNNKIINDYLNSHGADVLPVTILNDEIVISGRYPTNDEFMFLLSVPADYLTESNSNDSCNSSDCACDDSSCC